MKIFHARSDCILIEIKNNLRKKKIYGKFKLPMFFEVISKKDFIRALIQFTAKRQSHHPH